MIKAIIFDLDGTISKPERAVFKSLNYLAREYNITLPSNDVLRRFIGPPLQLSFQKYFNVTAERSEEMLLCYRKYYVENALFDCELFDGVEDMLKALCRSNIKILLATSKQQSIAEQTLKQFNIYNYFYCVCGSGATLESADKSVIVKNAVLASGEDKPNILMVGDRRYDIIGANDNGIKSVGVLYGYGPKGRVYQN